VQRERDLRLEVRKEGNLHADDERIGKKSADLGGCLNLLMEERAR